MKVVTRKATESDAAAACRLVRSSISTLCVDDHKNDSDTLDKWLANKTEANFLRWIKSNQHRAIVAQINGSVVGFGLLNIKGVVALLYVDPNDRFKGVSKTMLAAIENEADELGLDELVLDSSSTALRFYNVAGYVKAAEPYSGFGVTVCYPMSKKLRQQPNKALHRTPTSGVGEL